MRTIPYCVHRRCIAGDRTRVQCVFTADAYDLETYDHSETRLQCSQHCVNIVNVNVFAFKLELNFFIMSFSTQRKIIPAVSIRIKHCLYKKYIKKTVKNSIFKKPENFW